MYTSKFFSYDPLSYVTDQDKDVPSDFSDHLQLCFISHNTFSSRMMEHRLIFPELPRQYWKRLVMNGGLGVEVQLTGLHYPLTQTLWIFGYFGIFRHDQ
jgi:hypothetical protein